MGEGVKGEGACPKTVFGDQTTENICVFTLIIDWSGGGR